MLPLFTINGEKVNLLHLHKYKVAADGSVVVHIDREHPVTLYGDDAKAFLAVVEPAASGKLPAGLTEKVPAAPPPAAK